MSINIQKWNFYQKLKKKKLGFPTSKVEQPPRGMEFILFVHTGHVNFDFNWCSVLTECCFYPWKSSNGKIHSSSDSYHSIKKYPPAKFLTSYHPYPLPVFGKPCCSFCCLVLFRGCVIAPHVMCWALVPYYQINLAVCFMQQGIKFTEVWYIMWFFTGTLIWFDITHAHEKFTLHSSMISFLSKISHL